MIPVWLGIVSCGFISESDLDSRFDQDGDGFEARAYGGTDCDDDNRDINPDAVEVCDNRDNNCDGDVDGDALDRRTWYRDADEDGYGSPSTQEPAITCYPPDGFVGDATDCNDDPDANGAEIHPQTVWYIDDDGDGYGDPDRTRVTCIQLPGLVDNAEDCDDTDPTLHPETLWWADDDGDGFGDPENGVAGCLAIDGTTMADAAYADCDDSKAEVYPGAASAEPALCTMDLDGDGYGNENPGDGGQVGSDCDDDNDAVFPGAFEVFTDSIDNDCDGEVNVVGTGHSECQLLGSGVGEALGTALASPGDIDGDGNDDLLIGIPGESTYTPSNGGVVALLSPFDCEGEHGGIIRLIGHGGYNRVGASVAATGDVDADGFADFLVGAQDDYVYMVFGKEDIVGDRGVVEVDLFSYATSVAETATFGADGDGGPDGDGGGLEDDLEGDPDTGDSGKAEEEMIYSLYGPETEGGGLGAAVAGIGRFTGDGDLDIAISAPRVNGTAERSGRVYVFPEAGRKGMIRLGTVMSGMDPTSPPVWVFDAESGSEDDEFGYAVAGLGDINGDGLDDIAIGSPGNDVRGVSAGAVYLIEGVADPTTYTDSWSFGIDLPDSVASMIMPVSGVPRLLGEVAYDQAGATLAAAGDFNGDGYRDVVVAGTATGSVDVPGRVYVWYGGDYGMDSGSHVLTESGVILRLEPERGNGNLGHAIVAAGPLEAGSGVRSGDLDGDGYGDLLISAPKVDGVGPDEGEVVLVLGHPDGGDYMIRDLVAGGAVFQGQSLNKLGSAVASPGDMNHDGKLDLVLGAPGDETAGTGAGAALLYTTPW